jgi:hypothetical protein
MRTHLIFTNIFYKSIFTTTYLILKTTEMGTWEGYLLDVIFVSENYGGY